MIDLNGNTLMPAFIDGHGHISVAGEQSTIQKSIQRVLKISAISYSYSRNLLTKIKSQQENLQQDLLMIIIILKKDDILIKKFQIKPLRYTQLSSLILRATLELPTAQRSLEPKLTIPLKRFKAVLLNAIQIQLSLVVILRKPL